MAAFITGEIYVPIRFRADDVGHPHLHVGRHQHILLEGIVPAASDEAGHVWCL